MLVASYIPAMPVEQVLRHGITVEQTRPIFDAFASGDVERAIELTTPDLVEKLSFQVNGAAPVGALHYSK